MANLGLVCILVLGDFGGYFLLLLACPWFPYQELAPTQGLRVVHNILSDFYWPSQHRVVGIWVGESLR